MPKKDLDRWCRGKDGVEHEPVVMLDSVLATLAECHQEGTKWICVHTERCSVCDRLLKRSWQMKKEECPTYMDLKK